MLSGYILIILGETLLFRSKSDMMQANLSPFWSYRFWDEQGPQIIANIVLFIPFGCIASKIWKWKSIVVALILSFGIEFIQLISKRGLFEFDDIFNNCIGAVIGYLIYLLIHRIEELL